MPQGIQPDLEKAKIFTYISNYLYNSNEELICLPPADPWPPSEVHSLGMFRPELIENGSRDCSLRTWVRSVQLVMEINSITNLGQEGAERLNTLSISNSLGWI